MLSPVHLRTLQEVVRQGSFVGAANRLGYTPSAVSQQMAALERQTGIVLFDRSARSVRPNAAARTMVEHASAVLASLETMLDAAASVDERVQTVRMSCFPSLAARLVPRILADPVWQGAHLRLRVSVLDPSLAIHELRARTDVDIAIVYQMADRVLWRPSAYRQVPLVSDRFVVAAPSAWGLADRPGASIAQLARRPWILHHPASSDADLVAELFAANELRPVIAGRSDDYLATLSLVAGGLGAAYVPDFVLRDAPGGIDVIDVPELPMQRSVSALVSTNADPARVEPTLGAMRRGLAELGYEVSPADPARHEPRHREPRGRGSERETDD